MNKKKLFALGVGCLVLVLMVLPSFAACAKPAAKTWDITIAGGVAGGPLQVRAEGIAEALRKAIPNSRVAAPSTAAVQGTAMVATGKANMVVGVSTRMTILAQKGEDPFNLPYNVKPIALWSADVFMLIATPKAGINTFRDFAEKKPKIGISVGPPGSGSVMAFTDVFAAHGIKFEDVDKWGGKVHYQSQAASLDLLADGTIEAVGGLWTQPATRVIDLTKNRDMVFVALDEKAVQDLGKFGYDSWTMGPPPGFGFGYNFVNKATVLTGKLGDLILVSADMPVDQAYTITKALFEAKDYLTKVHASFSWMTPENTLSAGKLIDLHEGAKKYFREIGALK